MPEITSFLVAETRDKEVVTTYISSKSKHHYVCLHWISKTRILPSGWVDGGEFTFVELIVDIGPFHRVFTLV